MAYIKIKLDAALMDGHNVTFKAPCDCTAIEGIKVCYIENNSLQEKIFTMKDTHGNALAGLGNLFVEGAYVHAVLDSVNLIAYLLNADTNGYLERKINSVENAIAADHARIEDLVKNQIPEEYLHACVEDYINENDATLATKEEINYISSDVSNVVDFSNVNFATDKYRTYIYYNSANEVYRDGNITGYTNESNYIAYLVPIDETWCYVTYEWEDPINSKEGASIFWRTLSEKPYDNAPKNITINTFDYLKAVDNTTKMRVREIPTGTKYILFEVRKNNSDYSVEDALGKFKICKGSVYIPNDLCDKTVLNIGRTKYIESIGKNIINADYRLNDAFHTLDSEIVSSELGTREFYLAGATTLETYARIDEALLKCGRNYTKELIGYASDIDGNNNTELPIYCYHLRSNIYFPNWSHSNQETLLVVGSIHGDEKLSTYAIYKMIEEINGCNSILNSVLCSFNIDFVPIANPYGYDMMQRRNARGVDINRNFTSGWNEFKEKFDNGEMKAYYNCGVAPLSEKESQALQSLIDRNKNNYVALVDVHNRGLNDDFGASAVLYQIYSNNVELRKKVIRKIANIDSVWREEYGYSLLENQYDEKNGSIMEIEGGINSNLPQLVNEFSLICDTDVCCDIELPWAFYEDGTPKWRFAHPFQLIAVDGYINTLLGIAKYLE